MLGGSARPVVAKVVAPVVAAPRPGRRHRGHGHRRRLPRRGRRRGAAHRPRRVLLGHRRRHGVGAARPARRRARAGPRRGVGVRAPSSTPPGPGVGRRRLRGAGLVVRRRRRQPAADAARAAVPGPRHAHLLRQGARRGRRDPLRRRHRGAPGTAAPRPLRHRARRPRGALRAACRRCGCCSPAARSPSGSASSPSTAGRPIGRWPFPRPRRRRREREPVGPADRPRLRRRLAGGAHAARAGRPRDLRPGRHLGGRPVRARASASCAPTSGWRPRTGCPRPSSTS